MSYVESPSTTYGSYSGERFKLLEGAPSFINKPTTVTAPVETEESEETEESNSRGLTASKTGDDCKAALADYAKFYSDIADRLRKFSKPRGQGTQDEDSLASGGGGGGSIFEQIALALGSAMDKKLQELLDAAQNVSLVSIGTKNGAQDQNKIQENQKRLMTASAQVTARGLETNAISQAASTALNAIGQAAVTNARKTA